jgi:hypothetical protein
MLAFVQVNQVKRNTLDKKLEARLRYSQANPEDHGAQIQLALSYLRATRVQEARKLLDPVFVMFHSKIAWNPLAEKSHTVHEALKIPASLLDMAAIVSTEMDTLAVPLFEAASLGEHSELAFTTLDTILKKPNNISNLDLTRLLISTIRRRRLSAAELFNDFLNLLCASGKANLPVFTRLAWAALNWNFDLSSPILAQDRLQGVQKFAICKKRQPNYPCLYFPTEAPLPIEKQPTRQFGAHGGDYEFGPVMSLKLCLDHRFLIFDYQLLSTLKDELSALADTFDLPPFQQTVFSDGYGFSWHEAFRPPEESAEAFAHLLNAWQLLPGKFEYVGRRPFDILPNDEMLARRFKRDLMTHPGRSKKPSLRPFWSSPAMDLLARVGPGRGEKIPDCEDLLERARKFYAAPGADALERFYRGLLRHKNIVIPFSED